MNRRDFLRNIIKTAGIFSILPILEIFDEKEVKASNIPIFAKDLHIKNNSFTFSELENRDITDKIIIHHSGIDINKEISAKDVDLMHKKNGWAGIGYHMFIRGDGLIETGRPLLAMGAHTYKFNNDSVGICLHGNFNNDFPTDLQMGSLYALLGYLCQIYTLKPNENTVLGHRDFNKTACPGENLYQKMTKIRENVAKIL